MFGMTYYTVDEAARRLGVKPSLIRRLIKKGIIEAVRLGEDDYRITSTEIEGIENSGLLEGYGDEDEDEDEDEES
jgi:excisionase family DNA binding protein